MITRFLWSSCLAVLMASSIWCCQQPVSKVNTIDQSELRDSSVQTEILTDSCMVNGTTFTLYQRDSVAYVRVSGKMDTVYGRLLLKAPVYIVRAQNSDQVLQYGYDQFQADQVIMLFGNELSLQEREAHGVNQKSWCGSHIQGLIIHGNQASLTRQILPRIRCKGFSSDEKDFYSLAEMDRGM